MPVSERSSSIRLALFLATVALLALCAWKGGSLVTANWGLFSALILAVALVFFYLRFEGSAASSREIGIIAVLAVVAAIARLVFAAIPNIQATTFVVIVSGFVFGPRAGFMVGSTAALISNFFLGQGPWTPCQMFAWGLAGVTSGWLAALKPRLGSPGMVLFSFVWGYLFGWLMNLWFWAAFVRPLNRESFLVTYAASFPFDTFHALSNAGFYLFFGPRVIKVLSRFQKKLSFTFL